MLRRIASLSLTLILVVGVLSSMYVVQPAKAEGTIYIRSDGSVDPPTAPILREGDIYTLTNDVNNDSIVIERDNMTLDGNGHTVRSPENVQGLRLHGLRNVTITNMVIESRRSACVEIDRCMDVSVIRVNASAYGSIVIIVSRSNYTCVVESDLFADNCLSALRPVSSNYSRFVENTVTANTSNPSMFGIWLDRCFGNNVTSNDLSGFYGPAVSVRGGNNTLASNVVRQSGGIEIVGAYDYPAGKNVVSHNNVTDSKLGIRLYKASNNTLRNNIMINNTYNFGIVADYTPTYWMNDIDPSNTVDGKPIYYLVNECNLTIPANAGYLALINCTGITAKNLTLTRNVNGAYLVCTKNSTITNCTITQNGEGVGLYHSWNNTISLSNITAGTSHGLSLVNSTDNNIIRNNMINNYYSGIALGENSHRNTIRGNRLASNSQSGIVLSSYSSDNRINANDISGNLGNGIELSTAGTGNCVGQNNVTANGSSGIYVYNTPHGNFTANNVTANGEGIHLDSSSDGYLARNNMTSNGYNLCVDGNQLAHYVHDIDSTNTVNDKPVYYWLGEVNSSVPEDAGYAALVNCRNITVRNLALKNIDGILIANTTDSKITKNTIADSQGPGIRLYWSSKRNEIIENSIANNSCGIKTLDSSHNTIEKNTVSTNLNAGIDSVGCLNNTIIGNVVTNNTSGIQLSYSQNSRVTNNSVSGGNIGIIVSSGSHNISIDGNKVTRSLDTGISVSSSCTVTGNTIQGSQIGIAVFNPYSVVISSNNITGNNYGIIVSSSDKITISHNNITENTWYGLYLSVSYDATVSDNYVAQNGDAGLVLEFGARNNVTCNYIAENRVGIRISASNHTIVQGNNITANTDSGVVLESLNWPWWSYVSTNNSIVGNNITGNLGCGIRVLSSRNNSISENTISENAGYGVYLVLSSNNTLQQNILTQNDRGIMIESCNQSSLRNNTMNSNTYNFGVSGGFLEDFIHDVDTSNTVDSKPIYYWIGRQDVAVPSDAGYVALVNCTRITAENLTLTRNFSGLLLFQTSDSTITNCSVTRNEEGVMLLCSTHNVLDRNTVVENGAKGIIAFSASSYNSIIENNVTGNVYGIISESNNTVTGNIVMDNSGDGIVLGFFNNASENIAAKNAWGGISVGGSNNKLISNNVTSNGYTGISLFGKDNVLRGNTMVSNKYNFYVPIWGIDWLVQDVDPSNTVNGKPIYYWVNMTDQTVPLDAGFVALINCTRITAQDLRLANNSQGILLCSSSNMTIVRNVMTGNEMGVCLASAKDILVAENDVTGNVFGIFLVGDDCTIIHNNFVNNTVQSYCEYGHSNTWDDGYPSGGNYWSDFIGVDLYQGPYQNETGSDGIVDFPYYIESLNIDHYPLMNPWIPTPSGEHDIAANNLTASKSTVGQGYQCRINVTIENRGQYAETFQITLYANSTAIGQQTIHDLLNGSTIIAEFNWNTGSYSKGNYTISVVAGPVPGETHTADNTLVGGSVVVTIPGDVDGNFKVDIFDVVKITSCYGKKRGDLLYNPNADIDDNGVINIFDVVLCTGNYGKKYP